MSKGKKTAKIVLAVSMVLTIIFTMFMWGTGTDWGYVRSTRITVIGDDGLRYSGLMFVPRTATNENPAPAFMPLHGGSSQARDVEAWGVEMARRGFVVLIPDAAGGGQSERYNTSDYITAPVDALFKYLLTLPIVNTDAICIAGHSQGTESTVFLTNHYIDNLACVVNICGPYHLNDDQRFETNLLTIIGSWDNVLIQGDDSLFTTGSYKNLWMTFQREGLDEISGWTSTADIEIGKLYGSFENNTARELIQVNTSHDGGRYSSAAIAQMVVFIQNSVYTPNPLPGSNQVWNVKEFFGLLTILSLLVFLCALGTVLLGTKSMESVIQPLPQRVGFTAKWGWWFSAVMSVLAGIAIWFWYPLKLTNDKIFPANQLNQAVAWLLVLAIYGVIMFVIYHFTNGKKLGGNVDTYGLAGRGEKKPSLKLIGKSLLLSVIIVFVFFLALGIIEWITGYTPRIAFIIFSSITMKRLTKVPVYLLIYVVAFLVSALSMNVERRLPETGRSSLDTTVAVTVNVFIAAAPIAILLLVEYIGGFRQMSEPCLRNSLTNIVMHPYYGLPFVIGTAAGINTYFYRKTGTIWTGAFTSALLISINMLANNSLKI